MEIKKQLKIILIVGLTLRVLLIFWDNPLFSGEHWNLHPDETKITKVIYGFPDTVINPSAIGYPEKMFYIWPKSISNVGGIIWKLTDYLANDIFSLDLNSLGLAITIARLISIIGSMLGIVFAYKLGTLLFNGQVGVFAAAILSFPSYYLTNSAFATPDPLSAAAIIIGVWHSCRVYKNRDLSLKSALIAGTILGIAVSVKYTAVVVILSYLISFVALTKNKPKISLILIYAVAAVSTFIILDPVVLFRKELFFSSIAYLQDVHANLENISNSFNIIKGLTWLVFAPALAGIIMSFLRNRSIYLILTLAPVLVYLAKTALSFSPRYAISIAPVLAVFAGYSFSIFSEIFKNRKVVRIVLSVFVLCCYSLSSYYIYERYEGDSRYRLARWIDKNTTKSKVNFALLINEEAWHWPYTEEEKSRRGGNTSVYQIPEFFVFNSRSLNTFKRYLHETTTEKNRDITRKQLFYKMVLEHNEKYFLLETIEPSGIDLEALGPIYYIYARTKS